MDHARPDVLEQLSGDSRDPIDQVGSGAARVFLRANALVWSNLPRRFLATRAAVAYGHLLQRLVRSHTTRDQNPRTFFFRNRPELELIASLLSERPDGGRVRVAVLACSGGAEPYSLLWTIAHARPDLHLDFHAVDIDPEVVAFARRSVWDPGADPLTRMSPDEVDELFDREDGMLRVKQWMRDAITFEARDVTRASTIEELGPQDLVLANRFLTHMEPSEAEATLRQLSRLVAPKGFLVCTGVDVDVRTRVVRDLGWTAVVDRIEEVHEGDETLRASWPFAYWALEPLDRRRRDWQLRYATVFQRPARDPGSAFSRGVTSPVRERLASA